MNDEREMMNDKSPLQGMRINKSPAGATIFYLSSPLTFHNILLRIRSYIRIYGIHSVQNYRTYR